MDGGKNKAHIRIFGTRQNITTKGGFILLPFIHPFFAFVLLFEGFTAVVLNRDVAAHMGALREC